MQTTSPDTSFAPWSLMVPEPPKGPANASTDRKTSDQATSSAADRATKVAAADKESPDFFGEDGLTFGDFLDIINPLQHLPVIGTIYREITGDEISQGARLAGGTLFGGPLGLAGAVFNNAVESHTGKDVGDNIVAMFTGDEGDAPPSDTGSDIQIAEVTADPATAKASGDTAPIAAATNTSTPIHPFAVATPTAQSPMLAPTKPVQKATLSTIATTASAVEENSPPPGKPMRLSADVAQQLARIAALSQERMAVQAKTNDTAASKPTPAGEPAPKNNPPASPAIAEVTPPPAASVKAAKASKAYAAAAAAPPSLALDEVPEAMLSALKKYEDMLNKGQ